jgi:hypothetical protein
MPHPRVVVMVLGLLLIPSAPRHAAANEDEPRAILLYREGKEAFVRKDFVRAEQRFHEAYMLSVRPELLFDLALAQAEQDHCGEAAASLRAYLNVVGHEEEHRDILERIRTLEEKQRLIDGQRRRAQQRARRGLIVGLTIGGAVVIATGLGLGLGLGLPRDPLLTETTLGTHAGTR